MISYFIEVTICWILFYGIYSLFLRKETFFRINRWYLLSTLLLGLALPLLRFFTLDWWNENYMPTTYIAPIAEPIAYGFQELETAEQIFSQQKNLSALTLLGLIYGIGCSLFASRFFYGLYQIWLLYQASEVQEKKNGIRLVLTNKAHLPFSFFNCLFWSKETVLSETEKGKIFEHEQAHINEWHTLDVLFLECLSILMWCSPILFFYKKALRNIHEYLADAFVLKTTKTQQYGHLLLKQAQPSLQLSLAHHFIQSQLKKRIIMMTKTKSQKWKSWKYALGIGLFSVLLMAFSYRTIHTYKYPYTFSKELLNAYGERAVQKSLEGSLEQPSMAVYQDGERVKANFDLSIRMAAFKASLKKIIALYPERKEEVVDIAYDVLLKHGIDAEIRNADTIIYSIEKEEKATEKTTETVPSLVDASVRFYKKTCEDAAMNEAEKIKCSKQAMNHYLYTHLQFPEGGQEGNVVVSFLVDPDGSASEFQISLDQTNASCTAEALRLAKSIEKWVPAREALKGKSIARPYSIVIAFKAPSATSKEEIRPAKADEMPRFYSAECAEISLSEQEKKECSKKALIEFVYQQIKYPKKAREEGIEGTVVLYFIVDKDGNTRKPEVVRQIGGGCDQEALRVLDLMPKWIAGKKDGKNVAVEFILPIHYKLEDNESTERKEIIEKLIEVKEGVIEDSEKLKIYPNPARTTLNVSFKSSKTPIKISLLDMSGKVIYTESINDFDGILAKEISLENALKGAAVLNIIQDEKTISRKVIIQ